MKKTLSALIFLLALTGVLSAQTKTGFQEFSSHNGIYLVAGWGDLVQQPIFGLDAASNPVLKQILTARQMFKLGFSVKYQLFDQWKSGLFMAYTQTGFWNLLGDSSPFLEFQYNPEFFWRFKSGDNFAGDADLGLLDHVMVGLDHNSNGIAGPNSRSYDRTFVQAGLKFGEAPGPSLTAQVKAWVYLYQVLANSGWYQPETTDIDLYRSNWEGQIRIHTGLIPIFFLPESIQIKGGPGGGLAGFDWSKGYVQAQAVFGDLFGGVRPFVQAFYGSGESLINYSKSGFSLRLGIWAGAPTD